MTRKMTLHFEGIGNAMRLPGLRAAVHNEAQDLAQRARGLYAQEGMEADVTVQHGTNPRGRPRSRVSSTDVSGEFGTSRMARRRVLGRAAEQGR